MGRAAKSYTYDSGAVRLVYKAAGSEQKVYMEASSNGTAVAASNSRRQQNLVGILFCMLPVNVSVLRWIKWFFFQVMMICLELQSVLSFKVAR